MGSFGGPPLLKSSEFVTTVAFPQLRLLHCPIRPLSLVIGSSTDPPPANPQPADPDKTSRKHKRPLKEKLPRGFRRYETTVVLRPDITEEERLAWTQQYDEAIIAGGAVNVEFSNRGILPLTYSIKKKDMGGVAKTYLDGVYMHIAYITKPQSQLDLQMRFNKDDDVIRTITMLLK
eukprot:c26215_g1_i1 orf=223-750(-)